LERGKFKYRSDGLTSVKKEDAIDLLRKAGCSPRVIDHCVAVAELAGELAKRHGADHNLVTTAALLHDIGRSKTHGIDHAVVGAEIARNFGLEERVARIIERHIGAGIPADEAQKLGLPKKDYIPQTLEERIVAHADNLIIGIKKVTIDEAIKNMQKTLGERHPAVHRMKKLHAELRQ